MAIALVVADQGQGRPPRQAEAGGVSRRPPARARDRAVARDGAISPPGARREAASARLLALERTARLIPPRTLCVGPELVQPPPRPASKPADSALGPA